MPVPAQRIGSLRGGGEPNRILYAATGRRGFVLLHAVVKRATSLAERDIRLAERRLHTRQSRQAIQEK